MMLAALATMYALECGPAAAVIATLVQQHGERLERRTVIGNQQVMRFSNPETGSWTVVFSPLLALDQLCIAAASEREPPTPPLKRNANSPASQMRDNRAQEAT